MPSTTSKTFALLIGAAYCRGASAEEQSAEIANQPKRLGKEEVLDFLSRITYIPREEGESLASIDNTNLNVSQQLKSVAGGTAGAIFGSVAGPFAGAVGGFFNGAMVGAAPGAALGAVFGPYRAAKSGATELFDHKSHYYKFKYSGEDNVERTFQMRYSDMRRYGDVLLTGDDRSLRNYDLQTGENVRKLPDVVKGFDSKHSWFTSKSTEFKLRDRWFKQHFACDEKHGSKIEHQDEDYSDFAAKKKIYDMFVNFIKNNPVQFFSHEISHFFQESAPELHGASA